MTETKRRHGVHIVAPHEAVPDIRTLCSDMPEGECCSTAKLTPGEWALAEAQRTGASVRFRKKRSDPEGLTAWMTGTVSGTMFYDGLIGIIVEDDPDDRIEWRVHPEFGDEVELLTKADNHD